MSPLFGGGGGSDREREQRSADERERARQEREARRAAREGREPRALPPLPHTPVEPEPVHEPEPEPVAYEPVAYEPEPTYEPEPVVEAPEPVIHEPEPVAYEPEPVVHEPEPEPVVHEPEPVVEEPEPVAHEPEIVHDPEPVAFAPDPAPEPEPWAAPPVGGSTALGETQAFDAVPQPEPARSAWAHDETGEYDEVPAVVVRGRPDEPAGVKRVRGSAMASAAGAQGPPRFRAPPRGTPKRRRGARRVIPLVFLGLVLAIGFFLFRLYEPGADAGAGRVAVEIPSGSSARQIGDLLAERDVISSGFFFALRARLSGDSLRSGELELKKGMSYEAALAELTKAPPPAPVLAKVTLPEGPGREEFAGIVKEAGFSGSYTRASRRSSALDPRDYGAPRSASLEGFLFPATYELEPGSSARALVTQQMRAFRRNFAKIDMTRAKRGNLSRYDVLIIASMIEREALVAKDRRLISGVIYNRLKQGIPLGIDATIRYELDNFSQPLKQSELQRDTPYNTRTRQGLPPGPIGNPGLEAIRAAANPASNDFVYYVVKPCAEGAHAFSSTDAQFQRDVAAYNAKRDELGGKDPSQC